MANTKAQDAAKLRTLPFEDLKAHPEMLTEILSGNDSVPIFLERHGDMVSFGAMPTYSAETDQLLEEALAEHAEMKHQGYGREDGFAEFDALHRELAKRAGSTEPRHTW